jgi:hypothetical protein
LEPWTAGLIISNVAMVLFIIVNVVNNSLRASRDMYLAQKVVEFSQLQGFRGAKQTVRVLGLLILAGYLIILIDLST